MSFNSNAQTDKDSTIVERETFYAVEVDPKFPGGEEARMKFLRDNVIYPKEARETNIQGTVLVSFVIETDGSITNVQVIKSVHKSLDEETVRITKLMPNWESGTQKGKAVRVQYNMPLQFTLTDNTPSKSSKKKNR